MQPFVLELDMAYANDIMEKQKTAIQELDTTIFSILKINSPILSFCLREIEIISPIS
mgnify:CR=1 FL=1